MNLNESQLTDVRPSSEARVISLLEKVATVALPLSNSDGGRRRAKQAIAVCILLA